MDSENQSYNNFFLKGFMHGRFFEPIDDFYNFTFPDCTRHTPENITQPAKEQLEILHAVVGERLISYLFKHYELRDCGMWEGVDDYSKIWHNDFEGDKKMNTNVLVYLDDAAPYANTIEVKSNETEYTIIPDKGDFVWLNQTKNIYQHRATHNGGRRRILSFEYFIDGFNN